MSTITIDTTNQAELAWSNGSAEERIAKNVLNLIRTWRYDVAFNRTMGLNPAIVDAPAQQAAAMFTAEVYRLVETYEPRATVKEVDVESVDQEGNIQAKVVIEIVG